MEKVVSIIYAHRDREVSRIKSSLNSLLHQQTQNFEVIFVDYGSEQETVQELEGLFSFYDFLKFHKLKVSHLLWNKSKALNYGIIQAKTSTVFISDIDLIFHPEATKKFGEIATKKDYYLFELGYLEKKESRKLTVGSGFKVLKPSRTGIVNGMVLAPTEALLKINGFDEFFHFYGAEDEDLFARLENGGYNRKEVDGLFFYHNWHPSFSAAEDKKLTLRPRVKNIMRINQQHFLRNRERGLIKPLRQEGMGKILSKGESELLKFPSLKYRVYNIRAKVLHFLGEELPSLTGETVEVEFIEDPYYHSMKHKLKRIMGVQSQPYCSLKEVNDMVLKTILFQYRDSNYSFRVGKDLKSIKFSVAL